jgi:hypothetical protein
MNTVDDRDGSISETGMKSVANDQNGAVRKPVYENSEDCVSPLSVFVEDPATHPMLLTQTMAHRLSLTVVYGTIPALRLQTVFSITHSDHSLTQDGSSVITVLEMHTTGIAKSLRIVIYI